MTSMTKIYKVSVHVHYPTELWHSIEQLYLKLVYYMLLKLI